MRKIEQFAAVFLLVLWAQMVPASDLVWTDNAGIHRKDTADDSAPRLLFQTFDSRGITYDASRNRLIWSDLLPLGAPTAGGVIRSGGVDGGAFNNLVTQLTNPAGVEFDSRRERILWTDLGDSATPSSVFASNADGSFPQLRIRHDFLSDITGMTFDQKNSRLYISYVNPLIDSLFNGAIAYADLKDLSNIETVFSGLARPRGLAFDPASEQIFWAEAGLSETAEDGAIMVATFEGTPRMILGGLSEPYGIALDASAQSVFWTDRATGKIQRTSMSGVLPFFEDVVVGLRSPTAITIIPEPQCVMLLASGLLVSWATRTRRFLP